MALPGFTAEASIYAPARSYRSRPPERPAGLDVAPASLAAARSSQFWGPWGPWDPGGGWRCWFVYGCYICCNSNWCWYICGAGVAR